MLRIEQSDLAVRAGVSLETIKRIERNPGKVSAYAATLEAIQHALEAAGVEFTNGDEPGVKLSGKAQKEMGTALVGPDPFRGGDVQSVVTVQNRRPARPKKQAE
jgi:transcriptional regulator with XRE-family HTH domain